MPLLMAGAFEISSSEARRLIQQGGVKLDGEPIPADSLDIEPDRLDGQGPAGRQAPIPPAALAPPRQSGLDSAILPRPSGAGPGLPRA